MSRELEQFLGRGNEIAFWIFTYKNAGGAIVGGFVGNRIGELFGAGGGILFLAILAGIIFGLYITWNHKGIMRLNRWFIAGRFLLRRSINYNTIVDSSELYKITDVKEQPIVFRKNDGQTVIEPR